MSGIETFVLVVVILLMIAAVRGNISLYVSRSHKRYSTRTWAPGDFSGHVWVFGFGKRALGWHEAARWAKKQGAQVKWRPLNLIIVARYSLTVKGQSSVIRAVYDHV